VGDAGVRAPVDDVAGVNHGLRIENGAGAQRDIATRRSRRGTNRAVEERRAEPVKEPPIEAAALQLSHGSGVAVGQDGLRTIRRVGNLLKPAGYRVDRFIPADALESAAPFRPNALERVFEPVLVIDTLEIASDLLAQKPLRERVLGIAPQL